MSNDRPLVPRAAGSIRRFWSSGTYLPGRLIAALGLWSLALLGMFAISPTQYLKVVPLLAAHPADAPANAGPEERSIVIPVLGMEKRGEVPETTNAQGIGMIQVRIGLNILIRSGYLASASVITDRQGWPPSISYELNMVAEVEECAGFEPAEGIPVPAPTGGAGIAAGPSGAAAQAQAADTQGSGIEPKAGSTETQGLNAAAQDKVRASQAIAMRKTASRLAIAAVAVEKFHRSALQRELEWAYVQGYLTLFGRLPDISLGPAQIRVSRMRQFADESKVTRASESRLADILMDECESLKTAAKMMHRHLSVANRTGAECHTRANSENCPDVEELAAAAYAGQRRLTSPVVAYGPVVRKMASLLKQGEN